MSCSQEVSWPCPASPGIPCHSGPAPGAATLRTCEGRANGFTARRLRPLGNPTRGWPSLARPLGLDDVARVRAQALRRLAVVGERAVAALDNRADAVARGGVDEVERVGGVAHQA